MQTSKYALLALLDSEVWVCDVEESIVASGVGGRQTAVNTQPAIGVAGEPCDLNPVFTVDFGQGGAIAGPNGLTIGRFAWATPPTDSNFVACSLSNSGSGTVAGFVPNEMQGLNTIYLQDASMAIKPGFPAVLVSGGRGYFAVNDGATAALPGQTAYANTATGKVEFAAGTATASSWSIAAETQTLTGTIGGTDGNILTLTAVGGNTIYLGSVLTGGGVATNTQIVSQISGTPNGVGSYYISIPQQSAIVPTGTTYGLLTLTTVATGNFGVGDALSGTSVANGSTLSQMLTGTGGSGSTAVTLTATASSGTLTANTNVATSWTARSYGAVGALVKISNAIAG